MATKAATKKVKQREDNEQDADLWVDTALIARLHGRKSSPLSVPTLDAESTRLLHYADVALGTEKKEKFVSAAPTKTRQKEKE